MGKSYASKEEYGVSKNNNNLKELYRRATRPLPTTAAERWLSSFRNTSGLVPVLKWFVEFKYGKQYRQQYAEKLDQYLEEIKHRVIVASMPKAGEVEYERIDILVNDLKRFATWLTNETSLASTTIHDRFRAIVSFFDDMGHPIPEKTMKRMIKTLLPRYEVATRDSILTKEQLRRVIIESEKLRHKKTWSKKKHRWYEGPSTQWTRSYYLTLVCTGLRKGETLNIEVNELHLNDDLIGALPWIDLHRLQVESARRRGKRLPPYVFITPECRDAIREWLNIRNSVKRLPLGGLGPQSYSGKKVWKVSPNSAEWIWNKALDSAGLGERDRSTIKKYHIYRLHTLRKFFRTNLRKPTKLDPNWIPRDIVEGMMGHVEGLDAAYVRMTKEDLAEIYKNHMENVTIFTGTEKSKTNMSLGVEK